MNTKRFSVMVLLVFLVTCTGACGPKKVDTVSKAILTCPYTYKIEVDSYSGSVIDKVQIPTSEIWHGPDSDGNYTAVFADSTKIQAELDRINPEIERLETGINLLFPNGGFIYGPYFDQFHLPSISTTDYPYCDDVSYSTEPDSQIRSLEWFNVDAGGKGYSFNTRVNDNTTYVEVTSPKGSFVSYSFPTQYLAKVYDYAFNGGPALNINQQVVVPNISPTDSSDYAQAILKTMNDSDQNGIEAVSLSFNIDDYEGRQELRSVIAKGVSLGASRFDGPVIATLHAETIGGQKAMAFASAHGEITGMTALTVGTVYGTYEANSVSAEWFEQDIKGSIFVVPAP